jgi:hypothetical protein
MLKRIIVPPRQKERANLKISELMAPLLVERLRDFILELG